MKLTLTLGFFAAAALYASVGFGGGSTYTALLAVTGTPFVLIPIVSLLCNIVVVSANSWRYLRRKIVTLSQVWPLFILSIPAAFLGGRLVVPEKLFMALLCAALCLAGLRMVFGQNAPDDARSPATPHSPVIGTLIGACIGFFSGMVGIGGGIFLAPVLYRLKWGSAQAIAATCSLFILVNSSAGLMGQLTKSAGIVASGALMPYWPLILAVFIGGTFGNMLSLRVLSPSQLRRITGVLILAVAIRLVFEVFSLWT